MKDNALYEVIGDKEIPNHRHILKDEQIELRGLKAIEKCPYPLRRIEVQDPEAGESLVFITNHMDLGASTIAAIYKDRWQIETFFKALKQNLKIKTFVGTNPNAVRIQIWTALIAMLILRFLQLRSRFNWSLSNLVALLRMNLFTHRDLWAWLNDPYETPPTFYEPQQLELGLA
jgi:transposase